MRNLTLGNVKTYFKCDTNLKSKKGTFRVKFDTLPYEVKLINTKVSVFNGNLSLQFELNPGVQTKGIINHVVEDFDIFDLNLEKLKWITTTIILYYPVADGTLYAESECATTLCGEEEDATQKGSGGGEGTSQPSGDDPPADEDPTG